MKLGAERADLLDQIVNQPLSGNSRQPRNVVDRLFRIKFGALSARAVENVDQMAFEIEQAQLEHGEEPAWPRPDDHHICLEIIGAHLKSAFVRTGAFMPGAVGRSRRARPAHP